MLILTSTDKIQVITGGAQAVNVHASWMDFDGTNVTPSRTNTNIAAATTTDIVAAPAGGVQRNIKVLLITNTDGATPVTVTVQHVITATPSVLKIVSLAAQATLQYTADLGWQIL